MDLDLIKSKLGALQPEKKEKYEKIDYSKIYWKPKEEGKYQIRIVPSKLNSNPRVSDWRLAGVTLLNGVPDDAVIALFKSEACTG